MTSMSRSKNLAVLVVVCALGTVFPVLAQTFNSGSTGALGAFAPASNTTVVLPPDGVLNYTTVTIPAGVTVTFQPNSANTPVTLLAQGDVSIAGTINLNGQDAVPYSGDAPSPPSLGGPVVFREDRAARRELRIITALRARDRAEAMRASSIHSIRRRAMARTAPRPIS